jgi:glucosamine 6-phosphate synthetase-like amidotransferase/phosphosugar isomerase protein
VLDSCSYHTLGRLEINSSSVASTKAYTSQYVALVMMALQLSDDSISKEARRQEIIDGLHEIPAQIKGILMMDKALQQLAKETLAKEKSLLIMGRGYQCQFDPLSSLGSKQPY